MVSSVVVKLAACAAVLLFIAVVAAPRSAEASITCGVVTQKLAPCLGFLESGQGLSAGCCTGVRDLKDMAATTEDRRSACRCMKAAAAAVPAINPVYSAELPGKCGVDIPFPAGSQTDCSKIQ